MLNPSSDILDIQLEIDYMHPVDGTQAALAATAAAEAAETCDDQVIEVSFGKGMCSLIGTCSKYWSFFIHDPSPSCSV